MTDQSTTHTQTPDGIIGLATTLGALRADLNHHIEDQNRAFAELRSGQAERDAAQDARTDELEARLESLTDVVSQAVEEMEQYVSRNGSSPAKSTAKSTSPVPPARERGESNTAWHKRLATFAETHGLDAPPKPKSGPMAPSAATYDKQISAWAREIAE